MPQLGETVAEGKITKWFKSAGDTVKPGDNLFEIETDKVSMEVPSTTAGVARGNPRRRGRGGAGRRRGCGDRGRGAAASQPRLPRLAPAPPRRRQAQRLRRLQSRRAQRRPTGARHAAPIPLDPFFEVRTPERNFGPAPLPAATSSTPLARRLGSRSRHRSRARHGIRPAWPHRRARRRGRGARRSRARRRCHGARPVGRRGAWRSIATCRSRKCRSTACARPSPRGWCRPSRPSRISISPPMSTIGRLLALREEANAAAPKRSKRRQRRPIGSRSTISSSRCGRRRCSACPPPMRCGRKTASCASSIPTSASRSRSRAG